MSTSDDALVTLLSPPAQTSNNPHQVIHNSRFIAQIWVGGHQGALAHRLTPPDDNGAEVVVGHGSLPLLL